MYKNHYTPPKNNTYGHAKLGKEHKTTTDKRIIARKVLDELNRRIDSDKGLADVDTIHLVKFLQSVMPKEQNIKHDTNITYIANTPRPQIDSNAECIDITPNSTTSNENKTDGVGDGSHIE